MENGQGMIDGYFFSGSITFFVLCKVKGFRDLFMKSAMSKGMNCKPVPISENSGKGFAKLVAKLGETVSSLVSQGQINYGVSALKGAVK